MNKQQRKFRKVIKKRRLKEAYNKVKDLVRAGILSQGVSRKYRVCIARKG